MPQEPLPARLGARLRKLPGAAPVLDLRVRAATWPRERRLAARDAAVIANVTPGSGARLNVGSSGGHVEGWMSIDIDRDPEGRCVRMDAADRWPFASDAAEAINSEHFLEHLTLEQARAYFGEAYRVLAPGAVIRTSTPDLQGLCEAYVAGDPALLAGHRAHGYEAQNHADLVNNYFYMHGHRHLFDYDTIAALLLEVGFVDVERAAFGQSRHPLLRAIDTHDMDRLASLVVAVDAVKPRR